MTIDKERLRQQVESISPAIAHGLERELSAHFDKCGLFYRIFSRCKSASSTEDKLTRKEREYEEKGKKMQDLIGVRIVLYFKDDTDLCVKIIENNYSIVEVVRDEEKSDIFKPMKLNIVCRLPDETERLFSPELWSFPVDRTFEIQIRTIFSEGWHEVEHDLRYKHSADWAGHTELSRNLNGIFATLETCDWAVLNVLEELAYRKYRLGDWDAMLRSHLRIRLDGSRLSDKIAGILNADHELAKEFFRVDRKQLLLYLCDPKMRPFPKKLDNIVYLTNELMIGDPGLSQIVPSLMREYIEQIRPHLIAIEF